jgi:hypothetical protein
MAIDAEKQKPAAYPQRRYALTDFPAKLRIAETGEIRPEQDCDQYDQRRVKSENRDKTPIYFREKALLHLPPIYCN